MKFRELVRILKPGGILVISDMDEHNFGFLETEHNDRWMGFKIDCVGGDLLDASILGPMFMIYIATLKD
jgi:ubiquinone/menaquinone biosynthesis C-methylase UbiE